MRPPRRIKARMYTPQEYRKLESEIFFTLENIEDNVAHYILEKDPILDLKISENVASLMVSIINLEKIYFKRNKSRHNKAIKHGGDEIKKMLKHFETETKKLKKEGRKHYG